MEISTGTTVPREVAAELIERKSESFAAMLHAMRSPLNAIMGFAEALKDGLVGEMSNTQHEHVGDIFASGQELLSLINDFENPAKTAAGIAARERETGKGAGVPPAVTDIDRTANFPALERKQRIALVVDDDDKAANLLRVFLEAEDFKVLRALSGEDAILLAPQHTLALITLDIELYGINGWQVLQQMRKSSALARVPVVIISGRPVGDLALSRGAADVLQKPFNRVQLKASLAKLGLFSARYTGARGRSETTAPVRSK